MERAGRHALWCVALATAATTAVAGPRTEARVQTERAEILRSHVMKSLDGKPASMGDLKGDVVVVNFWASWCRPCRRELPELDQLHAELVKQGGRVVAISIDEDPRNAKRFAKEHKLSLMVWHDGPGGLAQELALDHIPYTMVLNRDGSIAFSTTGVEPDDRAELAAVARRLVAAGRPVAGGTQ
jgi:thiol-disulfide isomerase/thioredoxin